MITDLSTLPSLLTRTVDVACACLAATQDGTPAICSVYHGAGGPPADCCDALLVWVERIYPSRSFPGEHGSVITCGDGVGVAATVAVRLSRPCWPVVSDSPPYFPDPDSTNDAALRLAADAVQLYCCLSSDLTSRGSMILGGDSGLHCPPVTLGGIVPERNLGGCAGWTMRYTVGLDGCCLPVGS